MLAPKYEVLKLNTPKYVTLQKLTVKIEHCFNIFLYLYSVTQTYWEQDRDSDIELLIDTTTVLLICIRKHGQLRIVSGWQ